MSQESKPRTILIALVAALVAALAVIVWLLVQDRGTGDDLAEARERVQVLAAQDDAEKAALDAAKQVLVEFTTYSWEDGEHEFAWLDKIGNAELKEKLGENVEGLQNAIVGGKVTAQGEVLDAVARAVDDTQVEVLAFVDQAIMSQDQPDVRIEEQRVSMTMRLDKGAWLVDRLELLSGTNTGEGTE